MAEGTGNTAGAINVKFTASAAPVVAASAEAKAAIESVGAAGKEASKDVQSMAAAAGEAAGTVAALGTAAVGMGIAAAYALDGFLNKAEDARNAFDKMTEGVRNLRDDVAKDIALDLNTNPALRKIEALSQHYMSAVEKMNDAASSTLDWKNFKASFGLDSDLKDEQSRLQGVANQAAAQVAKRQKQIKEDAAFEDRQRYEDDAYAAKQVWDKFIEDKQKAEAKAEADRMKEMQRVEEAQIERSTRDLREREREMLNLAKERLSIEQQITREREQQSRGFGANDVLFGSSAGMNGTIGQIELANRWSD